MVSEQEQSIKSLQKIALDHMEKQYGHKFEYSSPWGNTLSGTHEFLVTSEDFPQEEFHVQIKNFLHDDNEISSNFMAVIHRNATIDFFNKCANSVFGDANVFYTVAKMGVSPNLSRNATLNEFLADTTIPLVILIEIKESNFKNKEQAQKVAELIAENGTHFYLTIAVVSDNLYGTFNQKSLGEHIALKKFMHYALFIKENDSIECIWRGGE